MKLRILVKIVEKILGMSHPEGEHRADMYLPERALAMALVFLAGGTACGIYAAVTHAIAAIVFAVLGLGLGVALLLCWKNQTIRIISEEQFVYKTMFGREHTYNFADIQGIRPNKDSVTLFVAGEKVHMESMAVLSEALVRKLNMALNGLNEQQEEV